MEPTYFHVNTKTLEIGGTYNAELLPRGTYRDNVDSEFDAYDNKKIYRSTAVFAFDKIENAVQFRSTDARYSDAQIYRVKGNHKHIGPMAAIRTFSSLRDTTKKRNLIKEYWDCTSSYKYFEVLLDSFIVESVIANEDIDLQQSINIGQYNYDEDVTQLGNKYGNLYPLTKQSLSMFDQFQ